METLLTVVVVGLFPCLTLLALLGLTARVERRRAAVIARQIELTDAIHREVGALVASWVFRRERRRHGGSRRRREEPTSELQYDRHLVCRRLRDNKGDYTFAGNRRPST